MSIQFNHTLVHARDKEKSAAFLTEILDFGEIVFLRPADDLLFHLEKSTGPISSHVITKAEPSP
jgi:hypothetical protein